MGGKRGEGERGGGELGKRREKGKVEGERGWERQYLGEGNGKKVK